MDKAYIDQQHVIDRYLQGNLEADRLAEFEIYLLDHTEIIEEIEFARAMQCVMLKSKNSLFSAAPSKQPSVGFWFGRKYAMVATVLLAATALFSGFLYQRIGSLNTEIVDLRNPLVITDEVWLEQMRGTQTHIIERQLGAALLLRVDAGPKGSDSYLVEIRNNDLEFSWTSTSIQSDDTNLISVILPDVPPGRYQISVMEARNRYLIAEYDIDLKPSAP